MASTSLQRSLPTLTLVVMIQHDQLSLDGDVATRESAALVCVLFGNIFNVS